MEAVHSNSVTIISPEGGDSEKSPGIGGEFVVITREEDDNPVNTVQDSVNVNTDLSGSVKGGRTKLIVSTEEIELGGGRVTSVSDNEISLSTTLGSYT